MLSNKQAYTPGERECHHPQCTLPTWAGGGSFALLRQRPAPILGGDFVGRGEEETLSAGSRALPSAGRTDAGNLAETTGAGFKAAASLSAFLAREASSFSSSVEEGSSPIRKGCKSQDVINTTDKV